MDIEIKALEKTNNRYTVQTEIPPDQKLLRSVNSILNKLTPEKFVKLTEQFVALDINTFARLRDVVSAIFEKSLSEAHFCPTYAEFCAVLNKRMKQFEQVNEQGKVSKQTFKRILLNQCQVEFTKEGAIDQEAIDKLATQEEKDLFVVRAKLRRLGTIRFIGELYLHGLIIKKIVYQCFQMLLSDPAHPDEENVQALCKLLHTVGLKVTMQERNQPMKTRMGSVTLQSMSNLIEKDLIKQSRIRFAVQDTLDMARNGWVARIKTESAKKLGEIHKDEERKRETERNRIKNDKRRNFDQRHFQSRRAEPKRTYHSNRRVANKASQRRDADGWESSAPSTRARGNRRGGGSQDARGNAAAKDTRAAPKGRGGRNNRNSGFTTGGGRRGNKQQGNKQGGKPRLVAGNAFDLLGFGDEEEDTEEAEAVEEVVEEKELTEEDQDRVNKSIKALIKEYFCAVDLKEAKLCVEELNTKQLNHKIVFEGIMLALEKRAREQQCFRDLLEFFITEGILTKSNIETGLNELMEWANDILPDFPLMFQILGKTLCGIISHATKTITLAYLWSKPTEQLNAPNRKKFVLGTLVAIKEAKGEAEVAALFKAAGTSLATVGIEAADLEAKGLECLAN